MGRFWLENEAPPRGSLGNVFSIQEKKKKGRILDG